MASIGLALLGIKSRLDEHLPKDEIERACRSLGHVWRRRVLDPATTVHLMLLQLLAGVGLCGLRHVSKLAVSAQAVAQARARLPVQLWTELLSRLDPRRDAAPASTSTLWKGLRAWIADGMSFLVPDTPELAGRYGRAMNQRGPSRGYPVPRLLCLLDRASGMIAKALPLPCGRQEHTCLSRLLSLLSAGDPLLGDRGLVSFAHLALLAGNGAAGLFRLPKDKALRRRAGGKQRRVRRLGKQDWLVQWHRTGRPAWMSARRWKQLPQSLVLRQVSFRIRRKGRRDRWGWLITTLLDPVEYPAQQLAELYGQRWQVEVCFRDLKRTLGLRKLSARGPEALRKELLTFVLLYNLVRGVMRQAADRQRVEAQRVSFVDALRWLLWSAPGETLPELALNPERHRATQPRRIKGGGKKYLLLNRPRSALQLPPAEVRV